jgi:hypothetical protein
MAWIWRWKASVTLPYSHRSFLWPHGACAYIWFSFGRHDSSFYSPIKPRNYNQKFQSLGYHGIKLRLTSFRYSSRVFGFSASKQYGYFRNEHNYRFCTRQSRSIPGLDDLARRVRTRRRHGENCCYTRRYNQEKVDYVSDLIWIV